MKIALIFFLIFINHLVNAEVVNLECNLKIEEYSLSTGNRNSYNKNFNMNITLNSNSNTPFSIENFRLSECKLYDHNHVSCSRSIANKSSNMSVMVWFNRNSGYFIWNEVISNNSEIDENTYHLHRYETGFCNEYVKRK